MVSVDFFGHKLGRHLKFSFEILRQGCLRAIILVKPSYLVDNNRV
ncbi:MAG: hypothetical protein AAB867_02280 [Patescibacteria group bacterium]